MGQFNLDFSFNPLRNIKNNPLAKNLKYFFQ